MDKELIILEQIQNNPHVNQRDLATVAQASLGMTNAILKRFAAKGLITIKKVNNRNIRYALTPAGMEEISSRSWSYFKRTIKNVVVYQDAILEIIKQVKVEEYSGIALLGASDFEFIIEHICYKQGISYQAVTERVDNDKLFYLIAESSSIDNEKDNLPNFFYLRKLILGEQANH